MKMYAVISQHANETHEFDTYNEARAYVENRLSHAPYAKLSIYQKHSSYSMKMELEVQGTVSPL